MQFAYDDGVFKSYAGIYGATASDIFDDIDAFTESPSSKVVYFLFL